MTAYGAPALEFSGYGAFKVVGYHNAYLLGIELEKTIILA